MTVHDWIGQAVNVKQVATAVVANTWAQGDTTTFTIANLDFVITIGTLVTTAEVATTIKQAYNGETLTDTSASCTIAVGDGGAQAIPQFAEFVASVSSSTVTFTARNTYGKPITMTNAVATAGDGDITFTAAATAAKGQHEADNADNFSGNAALVDNDTLNFLYGEPDAGIFYDLTLACQLAAVNKSMTWEGDVGNARINNDNSSKKYSEYRTLYLTSDDNSVTTTFNLETGIGKGSRRFMWDSGAGQTSLNIFGRGVRRENGVPCILWKGTHASNVVRNLAGDLGIAFFEAETATVLTLITGEGNNDNASTICGAGVTLGTATLNGGFQETNSAITAAIQNGGNWNHKSGTVTALTINKGNYFPLGAATHTTIIVGPQGVLDCRKGGASFVVTNTVQLYPGAKVYDPQGRMGNWVFKCNGGSPGDYEIVTPDNKTFTLS
jgi:hypothetical protein